MWNGSVLDSNIYKLKGNKLTKCDTGDTIQIVKLKSISSCILDELKPIFCIRKWGTHTTEDGTCFRREIDNDNATLIKLPQDYNSDELLNLLLFSEIVGYKIKQVYLYTYDNISYPVTINDTILFPTLSIDSCISKSTVKKYFTNYWDSMNTFLYKSYIRSCCTNDENDKYDEYSSICSGLKLKCEDIIYSISKEHSWLVNQISSRLCHFYDNVKAQQSI